MYKIKIWILKTILLTRCTTCTDVSNANYLYHSEKFLQEFNTTSTCIPSIQSFMDKLNEYLVRETSISKDYLYLLFLLKIHVIYNVREWIYTSKICNKLRMLADRFSVICQVALFYWFPSNWNLNNQIHTTQS